MSDLKPAYLFTGDDEVKIDRARKRLAARAQADGAVLEVYSAGVCSPVDFATALMSPSLLPGTRIVLVDGVENWRAADVGPAADAIAVLTGGGLDAVAVLICAKKPLKAIVEAITRIGGELREFKSPGPRELPKWLIAQAEQLGVGLDAEAARLMVETGGGSSRRLLSELEKLAIYVGPGEKITTEHVGHVGSGEASPRIFDLTDAAVGGDAEGATRIAQELVEVGESPQRIIAMLARSFGQAQQAAAYSERGRSGELASDLKLSPWLANKLVAQAKVRGGRALRDSLIELARLDSASKGASALDDKTELFRSLVVIAS